MKRGSAVGIGIGITIVIAIAVIAISGFESTDISMNDDQQQSITPSEGAGEGQRFHITLEDSAGSADNP